MEKHTASRELTPAVLTDSSSKNREKQPLSSGAAIIYLPTAPTPEADQKLNEGHTSPPSQAEIPALTDSLKQITLADSSCTIISNRTAVATMVDKLVNLPTNTPSLYIDLEGVNLSRKGTISILQLLTDRHTYLVDIHVLGDEAFSTPGSTGETFRDILESAGIAKVFFDVRNDSDALYALYKVSLAGIQDVQLMELATRGFSKRCVNGLSKCIQRDASLTPREKMEWNSRKAKGIKLFAPEHGGNYEIFNAGPLSNDILEYCVQDVQYFPKLWLLYKARSSPAWATKVDVATKERVKESQSVSFSGKGQHMALGP